MFNPLYPIVILLIFILIVVQVLYLLKENKRWYIYKLWGYGIKEYVYMLMRIFGTCYLISIFFSGACLILYAVLAEHILIYYFEYFIYIYIFLFITSTIVNGCFLLYLNKNINRNKSISSIKLIIFSSKLLVSLAVFMIISSSNTYYTELHDNQIRMNYWEKTKGIYRINIGKQDYRTNDLVSDDKLNKSIVKFFEILEKKKDAFIMASDNFYIVHNTNGKMKYFYQQFNTQNQYGEGGKTLYVSKNYFKFNPVYSSDGIDITTFFSNRKNTLNVIVPVQLKNKENELRKVYLDYFYFKKVYLENMYNKQLGIEKCKLTENDLNINFIYAKKGTEYFTYNFSTGSPKNNSVKDPIVILYDGKVNISELGAYATRCMYFVNDSIGNAYDKILPYINVTNASKYVTATYSVYNGLGDRVVYIRTKIKQIIIIEVTIIIISLLMTFVFVYLYYREKRYKLYLNYLFGYSFFTINRGIIALMLVPTIISGIFFYCFTMSILIIYYMISILFIEILFSYVLTKKMLKVNKMAFLQNTNG